MTIQNAGGGGVFTWGRIPKVSGLLCVTVMFHDVGTGIPSGPSGWTQITASAPATNETGILVSYRFLDGSESNTQTSNTTGSTSSIGWAYLIAGACRTYLPSGVGARPGTGGTTSAPANIAGIAGGGRRLLLAGGVYRAAQTSIQRPSYPLLDPATALIGQGTTLFGFTFEGQLDQQACNWVGTWTGSTAANSTTYGVIVRGP